MRPPHASWLLGLLAACAACSPGSALPDLSLRGLGIVHQRAADASSRRVDLALTVQLTFRPTRRTNRYALALLRDPVLWAEAAQCSDAALCAWANSEERATLITLGVPP